MAVIHSLLREIAGAVFTLKSPRVSIAQADSATDCLDHLAREFLPSGSGFDSGTRILVDECRVNRIVLFTEFHHMNEGGYYDGWTQHKIIVTPSFIGGFDIRVTGRNRREIKDYIAEQFRYVLERPLSVSFDTESREFSFSWAD